MIVSLPDKYIITDKKMGTKSLQDLHRKSYIQPIFNDKLFDDSITEKIIKRVASGKAHLYIYIRKPKLKLISGITQVMKSSFSLVTRLTMRQVAPQLFPDPSDYMSRFQKTNTLKNTYIDIIQQMFPLLFLDPHLNFKYYSYINYLAIRLCNYQDRVTFVQVDSTLGENKRHLESIEVLNPLIINTNSFVYDVNWLDVEDIREIVPVFLEPYDMMYRAWRTTYNGRWSNEGNYLFKGKSKDHV